MKLEAYLWPKSSLDDATARLASAAGIRWPELEQERLSGAGLARKLAQVAPVLVMVRGEWFLPLLKATKSHATILAPEGQQVRVKLSQAVDLLIAPVAAPLYREIDSMLDECGVAGARRERVRRALVEERLVDADVGVAWQVRSQPAISPLEQARQAGLPRRLAALCAAHLFDYGLWLAAWAVVGEAALNGHVDAGGLIAWAMLLLTLLPVRLWVTWSQGVLAVGAGGLLKQRLLAGALQLDRDALRAEGAGLMLGRTVESEALESLALSGGLAALLAVLEMLAAMVVLRFGAGGWIHVGLLAAWMALTFWLAFLYARRRARWTGTRLAMTHELVERMAGHRTRLTQEAPETWHEGEDQALSEYLRDSARLDRVAATLAAAVPRGWVLAAVAALMPWWIGAASDAPSIAIAIGGILLAGQSFGRLAGGLAQLAGAGIAWKQVAALFHAGAVRQPESAVSRERCATVLDAADVGFEYRAGGPAVLRGCSLAIRRGDFVLLEGGSGSGKSTLASLIAGLRRPGSGLLLAGGLDLDTLGESGWRRRVACAPQYHENHVLAGSFAFNLLMGREWPPTEADLKEAAELCREMGLGPLLERMPGGMYQMVGETGWQLSQGEKSRLYMARALLQGGDLVVLDESFAALDPESLKQSLECVLRRAETLLVVAHP